MRQARIVPEKENGKVVGIRLFGVKPDTLLGTLGMENGDRLEKINGFDMASPEKALEAYARLRTADHLTVSVNRTRPGHEPRLQHQVNVSANMTECRRSTTGRSCAEPSSPRAPWSERCVLFVGTLTLVALAIVGHAVSSSQRTPSPPTPRRGHRRTPTEKSRGGSSPAANPTKSSK